MNKRVFKILGLLIALWIVLAAFVSGWACVDAKKGQHLLDRVVASDIESLRNGSQDARMASASKKLRSAHDKWSGPLVAPFRAVPFVGHQIDSATILSKAGADASTISLDTLRKVRVLADRAKTDRVDALRDVSTVCADSDTRLRKITLGTKTGLVGPLSGARREAVDRLNGLDEGLVRGGAAADGFANLLSGSSNYMLIAANNAEMRNGSGMFLQAGLLTTGGGKLDVSDMGPVGPINRPEGEIAWPADIEANWGWLAHRGDMRNLMLSPRYDVSAQLAKQIWERSGRPHVDGVITLDVAMLKALLAVTGPVDVGGRTYTEDNVEQTLLLEQYDGVDATTSKGTAANLVRHEEASDVAKAVFDKVASGDWDLAKAAKQLGQAARARHMLIWSADPAVNQHWIAAGVSGMVEPTSTSLALVNFGTNKLDQFMKVDATVAVDKAKDTSDTTLTVTVRNVAPETGSSYVLGPAENSQAQAGEYVGMLAFTLPDDVTNPRFDGNLTLNVNGRDGNNLVVATGMSVPRGNSQKFVLHYSRPAGATETTIEPTARIPAVIWHMNGSTWSDEQPHNVDR